MTEINNDLNNKTELLKKVTDENKKYGQIYRQPYSRDPKNLSRNSQEALNKLLMSVSTKVHSF